MYHLKYDYYFSKSTSDIFIIQRGQHSPNYSPKMAKDRIIIQQTQSRRNSLSCTWGGTQFCSGYDMPILFSTCTNDVFSVQRGHTLPKMANGLVFRTMIQQIEKVLTTRHLERHWVKHKNVSPAPNTQMICMTFLF